MQVALMATRRRVERFHVECSCLLPRNGYGRARSDRADAEAGSNIGLQPARPEVQHRAIAQQFGCDAIRFRVVSVPLVQWRSGETDHAPSPAASALPSRW